MRYCCLPQIIYTERVSGGFPRFPQQSSKPVGEDPASAHQGPRLASSLLVSPLLRLDSVNPFNRRQRQTRQPCTSLALATTICQTEPGTGFLFITCHVPPPLAPSLPSSSVLSPAEIFLALPTMSEFQGKPWSDNPNAPKISPFLYHAEKANLAGTIIGSILYGACDAPHPTRLLTLSHFVCSVCYKDPRRAVFPMYGRPAEPRPSQGGEYQVGARILHRAHVLVCDRVRRDEPQHPIPGLHRQSRIPSQSPLVRTAWIPGLHSSKSARDHPKSHVPLELFVSRWPFG